MDLGCGHAPLYVLYRSLVHEAVLIDWENTHHPSPCLDAVCDLNERVAWADSSVDTVLATDVLEHLHNPDRLMAEIVRVLRPGGTLIVGVPFLYWIHEEPYDYHRYTEFRLRQLCEMHGLSVEELVPTGGAEDVLIDLTAKLASGVSFLSVLHSIATWMYVKLRSSDARARSGWRFPLGYALAARKPYACDTAHTKDESRAVS